MMKLAECLGHGLLGTAVASAVDDVVMKVLVGVLVATVSTVVSHFIKVALERRQRKHEHKRISKR